MNNQAEPKTFIDGKTFWYLNGVWHREGGPALEYPSGLKYWYLNGKRHREDGPAVEYPDGQRKWFLNGKEFILEKYLEEVKKITGQENLINILFYL
jgi:hypothetical protein